jgi:hypothetical protein
MSTVPLTEVYSQIFKAAQEEQFCVTIMGKLKKVDVNTLKGLGYSVTEFSKSAYGGSAQVIISWSVDLSVNYFNR